MCNFESVYKENELIFGFDSDRKIYLEKARAMYPSAIIFKPEDILNEFIGWYVKNPKGYELLSGKYSRGVGASAEEIINYTLIQQSYGYGIKGNEQGELFDEGKGSEQAARFKKYLEKHPSYGPYCTYAKNDFIGKKTDRNYFATRLRLKHACKCMIEYFLFVVQGNKIHFILDGIDLKAVAEKNKMHEITHLHIITHKELRKLSRLYIFEPSIREKINFWKDLRLVKPPWFSEDYAIKLSWKTYIEGFTKRKILSPVDPDKEENLLGNYKALQKSFNEKQLPISLKFYK